MIDWLVHTLDLWICIKYQFWRQHQHLALMSKPWRKPKGPSKTGSSHALRVAYISTEKLKMSIKTNNAEQMGPSVIFMAMQHRKLLVISLYMDISGGLL